jgi:hypothetical protein
MQTLRAICADWSFSQIVVSENIKDNGRRDSQYAHFQRRIYAFSLYNPTIHITSHNASGQALQSSKKAQATAYPEHNFQATLLYTTSDMPADLNDEADIKLHDDIVSSGSLGVVKKNGTVCRFADFAPCSTGFMHRTQSLDYGIVLEGNVVLEPDDGSSTPMTRGDVAIQRGTMHAWRNSSQTEWARVLFDLQDCKPLTVNGERFKEDLGHASSTVPSSGNDVDDGEFESAFRVARS